MIEQTRRTYLGLLVGSVGVSFAIAGLTLWFGLVLPRTTAFNQMVLGIVVHVLFGYIVVMSGIVVYRSELPLDQCLLAAKWCLGGAAFMGTLVIWRAVPELRSGTISVVLLNELVIVGSVGAAAGVLVGVNRGHAIQNRQLVSQKKEREETLVFLLRLLDHDIGNHLLAISNHARSIRPSTFDPSPTPAEAIEERAANIEQLLETANVILESETGESEFNRVHLSSVLRERVDVIGSDVPDVEIHTDIDDDLYVEADRFLGEVFGNLIENAVVHNAPKSLTIAVTATANDDTVGVEIADDGSGIPQSVREDLFDPGVRDAASAGDGVGLYLVRKLVTTYGGTITVSDREPTGTRVRLLLPKATGHEPSAEPTP